MAKKTKNNSARKPELPLTLYSHWFDGDGVENRFLETDPDPKRLRADDGGDGKDTSMRVGVYKLHGIVEIRNSTTIEEVAMKLSE